MSTTEFAPMITELTTERLVLRRMQGEDSQAIRALWMERDPRVPRRIDHQGNPTVEQIHQRMMAQLAESEKSGLFLLAIEKTSGSGLLGYCGLTVGAGSYAEPEIAFELFKSYQGCGFATEAGAAVIDAARATARTRLWATVREWNAPSFRVLARLGFSDSGRRTKDAEHGDTLWLVHDLSRKQ
ncbi:RimJ/RimL family protein N-acetyltransferase [Arthrobacter sp. CAN_A212]|uniref:GNAT family N-acetyltransferase n=1 Tax=Arthrobacter sp. CAN_A212 TaxID=2787719 RepID=UPI0018C9A286